MPLREALAFVYDALTGFDLKQHIKIIASGKVATGFDLVKNFALGADMCNSARAMMMAKLAEATKDVDVYLVLDDFTGLRFPGPAVLTGARPRFISRNQQMRVQELRWSATVRGRPWLLQASAVTASVSQGHRGRSFGRA